MASSSSSSSCSCYYVRLLTGIVVLHVAAANLSINNTINPTAMMATSSPSISSLSSCYKSIYSFGDSFVDTGNILYDPTLSQFSPSVNPPYGDTFFHRPTGRSSDGRLVIDFFAEHMGISLLKPYLGIKNGKMQDWNKMRRPEGVNFATGGATASDPSFFVSKGIDVSHAPTPNYSLRVQLDWFKELLPSICNSSSSSSSGDCKQALGTSLFFLGETGFNDFNLPLILYRSIEEIRTYVPHVINEISSTINNLIDLGATTLVVPGHLPCGCFLDYLRMYHSTNMDDYDEVGCLKWLNEFSEYYNNQLFVELNRLQLLHPLINIIYADYYNAALPLYHSPSLFGFKETFKACCGGGDPNTYYDESARVICGKDQGVIPCDDPSQYISWDGTHMTEAANKWIAQGLLNGPYTYPQITTTISCHSQI